MAPAEVASSVFFSTVTMRLSTAFTATEDVSCTDRLRSSELTIYIDAEYCRLRSEAAVPIPKNVDPAAVAPLLCAGVTVFNGIRQMDIRPGETVAIQGLGGLGHLGIQYASKMGYRTVALSSSGAKEKFARDLGAHEYIDGSKEDQGEALSKLGGAALIVCTAPDSDVIQNLLNGLGVRGRLLIVASKFSMLRLLFGLTARAMLMK